MKKKRLLALLVAVIMVFATLALAACANETPADPEPAPQEDVAEPDDGDDDVDVDEPDADEPEVDDGDEDVAEDPAPPTETAGRTRGDGILVVGRESPQSGTFSPFYAQASVDHNTVNLVHQKLLHFDVDDNVIPVLAADLPEISEDGYTFTFTLRDDVFFSNGMPFTAYDVAFTFNVLADSVHGGPHVTTVQFVEGFEEMRGGNADSLSGITVLDDYTIEIRFSEARVDNISMFLTFGITSEQEMLNRGFEFGNEDAQAVLEESNLDPIGTGPFQFVSWDVEVGSVHIRNPYYWGTWADGAPEMVIIREVDSQFLAQHMEAGDIDYFPMEIMGHTIDQLVTNPQFGWTSYTRGGLAYFAFNTVFGPTADVAVRQALTLAFDRDDANYHLFGSRELGQVAFTPATFQNPISAMGPYVKGEAEIPGLEPWSFDPDRARTILDEAGWEVGADGIRERDGERLTIQILAMPDHVILDTVVPIWISNWGDIGVDVQVAHLEFLQIMGMVNTPSENIEDWNVFFLATSYTTNLMTGVRAFFHSDNLPDGWGNTSQINDPELDRLLDAGALAFDPDEALEIFKEFAVRLNEVLPMVPIYSNIRHDFWDVDIIVSGFEDARELRSWEYFVTQVVLRD